MQHMAPDWRQAIRQRLGTLSDEVVEELDESGARADRPLLPSERARLVDDATQLVLS